MTVYETPVVSPILSTIAWLGMKLAGWKWIGQIPDDEPKLVALIAPHSSNWDFPLIVAVVLVLRL